MTITNPEYNKKYYAKHKLTMQAQIKTLLCVLVECTVCIGVNENGLQYNFLANISSPPVIPLIIDSFISKLSDGSL